MNWWKMTGLVYVLFSCVFLGWGLTLVLLSSNELSNWEISLLVAAGVMFLVAGLGLAKKKVWSLILVTGYEMWTVPMSMGAISLRLERDYFWQTLKDPNQIMDVVTVVMVVVIVGLWKDFFKSRRQKGISSV
jgi:hypothetical protein